MLLDAISSNLITVFFTFKPANAVPFKRKMNHVHVILDRHKMILNLYNLTCYSYVITL